MIDSHELADKSSQGLYPSEEQTDTSQQEARFYNVVAIIIKIIMQRCDEEGRKRRPASESASKKVLSEGQLQGQRERRRRGMSLRWER